jgi:hypothetical protein
MTDIQTQLRAREAERKGLQLCNLAGTMMLACKRLLSIQKAHALRAANREHGCECDVCCVALPDLSDEAIKRLVNESNIQYELIVEAERRGK